MDGRKVALVSKLMRGRETPISEVCGAVGVSKATLYRSLKTPTARRGHGRGTLRGRDVVRAALGGARRILRGSPPSPAGLWHGGTPRRIILEFRLSRDLARQDGARPRYSQSDSCTRAPSA
jgi:hypothetical protein